MNWKGLINRTTDFHDVTQDPTPHLSEEDRVIIKNLIEGVFLTEFTLIDEVIRQQLAIQESMLKIEDKNRITHILNSVDWKCWRGQFKLWLRSGKWFNSVKR